MFEFLEIKKEQDTSQKVQRGQKELLLLEKQRLTSLESHWFNERGESQTMQRSLAVPHATRGTKRHPPG
jgi:hypothetical protein